MTERGIDGAAGTTDATVAEGSAATGFDSAIAGGLASTDASALEVVSEATGSLRCGGTSTVGGAGGIAAAFFAGSGAAGIIAAFLAAGGGARDTAALGARPLAAGTSVAACAEGSVTGGLAGSAAAKNGSSSKRSSGTSMRRSPHGRPKPGRPSPVPPNVSFSNSA